MREYRCRSCGRLLFRSPSPDPHGRVEIVCPDRRCRAFQAVLLEPERESGLTPLPAARRLTPETA
jgi:phage FluMu protein Com